MKDCDHEPCSCEVADDKEFCSSACAEPTTEFCECPHHHCTGHDEAGRSIAGEA